MESSREAALCFCSLVVQKHIYLLPESIRNCLTHYEYFKEHNGNKEVLGERLRCGEGTKIYQNLW